MPVTNKTSYTLNHARAYVGQIADLQLTNRIAKTNATGEVIPFGTAVVRDGAKKAKPPESGSVSADIIGVVIRERGNVTADSEVMGAVPGKELGCMTMGTMYVKTLDDVTTGDSVYVRVGETETGNFCKSAGADATLSVVYKDAFFAEDALADSIVKISVNLGGV